MLKETSKGHAIVVKYIKDPPAPGEDPLDDYYPMLPEWLLKLHLKNLIEGVIGWRWLRHENILPFVGIVLTTSARISIASEFMENGNIMDFIRKNQDYNRVDLVGQVRMVSLCCIDHLDSSLAQ